MAIGDMTSQRAVRQTERHVTAEGIASKRLPVGKEGTVLFAMYASVGTVSILDIEASWNQAILGMEPIPSLADRQFLFYWLLSLRPHLREFFRSNTQDNLNADQVGNLPYPVLTVEQQRAIADFLDAETARIDALIAKKRRLATKLGERRLSTMLRGVSGRLMSSVRMVDSRLPWVSHRPEHWDEPLLRLLARLGSGHTPSRSRPEWWTDCTIPWITTGEVTQMREDRIEHITETREKISETGMANSSAELHPSGTVVLSRTASAGFSAIMGQDMATSQDFVTWTCGPLLDPRYLLLCLRAMRPDLLGRLAQGSTHKTIYMPDIETIRIPLPALREQKAIVEAVWRSLHKIDKMTSLLGRQIQLLLEHRQALITAAVTGEIEVPGTTIPQP